MIGRDLKVRLLCLIEEISKEDPKLACDMADVLGGDVNFAIKLYEECSDRIGKISLEYKNGKRYKPNDPTFLELMENVKGRMIAGSYVWEDGVKVPTDNDLFLIATKMVGNSTAHGKRHRRVKSSL